MQGVESSIHISGRFSLWSKVVHAYTGIYKSISLTSGNQHDMNTLFRTTNSIGYFVSNRNLLFSKGIVFFCDRPLLSAYTPITIMDMDIVNDVSWTATLTNTFGPTNREVDSSLERLRTNYSLEHLKPYAHPPETKHDLLWSELAMLHLADFHKFGEIQRGFSAPRLMDVWTVLGWCTPFIHIMICC